MRGLVRTGRPDRAADLLDPEPAPTSTGPPQWQTIMKVTTGEILAATGELHQAETELAAAITVAEHHRLPHQIQRAARASSHLPGIAGLARQALSRLWTAGTKAADH